MEWLKNLYEKLAFQRRYDEIKSWELTAEQKKLLDDVWEKLSPTVKKALWSLVALILAKYGPDTAKALLEAILKKLADEGINIG